MQLVRGIEVKKPNYHETDRKDFVYGTSLVTTWIKAFMAVHTYLIRETKGRLGSRAGKHSFLLLHTVGRKSGRHYATPLSYFRDGDRYLLVGSNWGRPEHPDWFFNLQQQHLTSIQIGETDIQVEAHQAQGAEYDRLWKRVTRQNGQYRRYQENLERRIPIVVLTPMESA